MQHRHGHSKFLQLTALNAEQEVVRVHAGSAKTDAAVAAALAGTPEDKLLQEYRARLLNVVKASYGGRYSTAQPEQQPSAHMRCSVLVGVESFSVRPP